MFCKKCHKKIIKVVKNLHEIKNRCVCGSNDLVYVATRATELTGVVNGRLSELKYKKLR